MRVGWLVLLWQHVVCSLFCTHVCVPLWVLIPKLKESSGNTSVLTSVLVAVGELAQVPGPEMAMYADDIFSIIIDVNNAQYLVHTVCCVHHQTTPLTLCTGEGDQE